MTLAWALTRIALVSWLISQQHWYWLVLTLAWMLGDTWLWTAQGAAWLARRRAARKGLDVW